MTGTSASIARRRRHNNSTTWGTHAKGRTYRKSGTRRLRKLPRTSRKLKPSQLPKKSLKSKQRRLPAYATGGGIQQSCREVFQAKLDIDKGVTARKLSTYQRIKYALCKHVFARQLWCNDFRGLPLGVAQTVIDTVQKHKATTPEQRQLANALVSSLDGLHTSEHQRQQQTSRHVPSDAANDSEIELFSARMAAATRAAQQTVLEESASEVKSESGKNLYY